MAKCVVCTFLNAEIEHKKRMKTTKNEDGTTSFHNHYITGLTVKTLRRRRTQFSSKLHPHKFCVIHGGPNCTGRSTGIFKIHRG
jgi:hypothetical protein